MDELTEKSRKKAVEVARQIACDGNIKELLHTFIDNMCEDEKWQGNLRGLCFVAMTSSGNTFSKVLVSMVESEPELNLVSMLLTIYHKIKDAIEVRDRMTMAEMLELMEDEIRVREM